MRPQTTSRRILSGIVLGAAVVISHGRHVRAEEPTRRDAEPLSGNEAKIVSHTDGQKGKDGWTYDAGLSEPEWSPDGRFIAFTKHLKKYMEEHKNWHGRYEVLVVSAHGSGVRRVAQGMKLYWQHPAKLVYAYSTPREGNPVVATHFASIDIPNGKIEQLGDKPDIPVLSFQWAGSEYSVLDTKTVPYKVGDESLQQLIRSTFGERSRVGLDIDFQDGFLLYSRVWQSIDAGRGVDILCRFAAEPSLSQMVVRDGSWPSLSPDGRRLAFIRGGNLWVKKLAKPITSEGSTDNGKEEPNQ